VCPVTEQWRQIRGVPLEVLALSGRPARIPASGRNDELPSLAELGLPFPRELRAGAAVYKDDGLS